MIKLLVVTGQNKLKEEDIVNNFFDYNINTKQYNGSVYEVSRTSEALWQEWLEINKRYEKCIITKRILQISDLKEQFEILVPVYSWENYSIKTVIEEYRKALKVSIQHQKEIVFYRDSDYFINEDIEWNNYCDCCVELKPATLQVEDIEQVKSDFLLIISNTSVWDEKLMLLIKEKAGKGKAAYDEEEFGFIGFQLKSKHIVSFWYADMNEDYIELCGSIEDDMWTVSKRENCNFGEW